MRHYYPWITIRRYHLSKKKVLSPINNDNTSLSVDKYEVSSPLNKNIVSSPLNKDKASSPINCHTVISSQPIYWKELHQAKLNLNAVKLKRNQDHWRRRKPQWVHLKITKEVFLHEQSQSRTKVYCASLCTISVSRARSTLVSTEPATCGTVCTCGTSHAQNHPSA